MTIPVSPESARSWLNTFYLITEKSTPITMCFILAFLVFGYFVTKKEIKRLHHVNQSLWTELRDTHEQMLKLALECREATQEK